MADFYFDGNKSSAENCKAFLEAIKVDNPHMAAILQDNWDALVAVVRKGQRVMFPHFCGRLTIWDSGSFLEAPFEVYG